MDWCIKPFAQANHPPAAVLNGDRSMSVLTLDVLAGKPVTLTAAGSDDSDRGSALAYRWIVYPEPGSASPGVVVLSETTGPKTDVKVLPAATGRTVHVVLTVTDDGTPPLTRYRRAVIRCVAPD